MIAPNIVVTALLSGNEEISAMSGNRIYSPRLASGYKPEDGPALVHFVRGGPAPSLYTPVVQPSVQVTAWGGTPGIARQMHTLAYKAIHGIGNVTLSTVEGEVRILWAKADTFPEDVTDPGTGWFTVTSFFTVAIINPCL